MAEYIDRETALSFIAAKVVNCNPIHFDMNTFEGYGEWTHCSGWNGGVTASQCAVKDVPAADVRPVVRGVWLNTTEQNELHDTCVSCSICGDSYVLDDWGIENLKEMFNFCPNCGADMRDQANKAEDAE